KGGKDVQIPLADAAAVLAGILSYQEPKTITSDANNANKVGDYNISFNALNNPAGEWLAMKVLGKDGDIAQIAIGLNTGKTFSRIYKPDTGWSEWKRLDNV
ncbi:MAG: pyocin knob domain-containing protein, partial [Parabacteroides sp.]|nr:pyocin knob domain-containing protein [Parabacteroides sp.]